MSLKKRVDSRQQNLYHVIEQMTVTDHQQDEAVFSAGVWVFTGDKLFNSNGNTDPPLKAVSRGEQKGNG